ncbi:MAK10-like protein [Tanacetum coccineum]
MNSDIEDDIMDPVMQCTTLPSHSSFSQQKLISFVTEIHTTSIDFLTPIFILINEEPWLYGGGGIPFQLKSDSLPHAHAQITKTYYKHQDSRIKKAQELKTKTLANSDIQDLPSRYQVYQGRLLASFQDDAKIAKLFNDILMFQQHHGESLSKAWTHFNDLLQKVPHHGIDLWLQVQIFYDHVNPVTRRTIDQSAGGKLRDRNVKESWALLKDLALYDNESWNDPRDFAKLVKAIVLPQDVPSTFDRRLIKLENQVQRLMEAYLAPTQPTQVNKITTSCEICNGPHDTQYCMDDSEQVM